METRLKRDHHIERKTFSGSKSKSNMEMKMMRSFTDKAWLHMRSKKNDSSKNVKNNKFLITVNVFGSAGPLRFLVNNDDIVAGVIESTLKLYAREGRLPILGSDINYFVLYPVNTAFDALEPSEAIGSYGVRNFVLCKKERQPTMTEGRSQLNIGSRKTSGWRVWLQKSFSLKILAH